MPPTHSQMNESEIYTHDLEENQGSEIKKEFLRMDFYSSTNKEKRKWFFKTYSQSKRLEIQEKFYKILTNNEVQVTFFTWFEIYAYQNSIDNPFSNLGNSSIAILRETNSKATSTQK